MSLLTVKDLSLAFGARQLLLDVCFPVSSGDRVGFVGPNGAGKSTLMKLIGGVMAPDSGTIQLQKGARLGYLPQEIAGTSTASLLDSVLDSVPKRGALESQLRQVEAALSQTTQEAEQLELAQQLADLSHELSNFETQFGPHRAMQILSGLGFKNADFPRPLAELSGGWRMRAALAGLLLQQPELLLLDEPTNHLDLPTLEWFDDFLARSRSALILISHDRDFLNRHVERIIAIEPGGIHQHTGDYDSYEDARELRRLQNEAAREANLQKRAELQAFIDRFGAKATKAKQAQSRQKQLDKLDDIQATVEHRTLRFRFPEVEPSVREVLKLEGVTKRFGDRAIYDKAEAIVQRGDRIAIVGVNGAGKTTLLKLIADELPLDAGSVAFGQRVVLAYYAQHHGDKLDLRRTIYEELDATLPDATPAKVRQTAGAFMFSGDDVDKSISVLSGGERARVALAKLLLVPSNFLLLDEPTNHLDLDSSEALIAALGTYTGTMLFVSHNESFVRQLATKIWEVREGKLDVFPGDFDAYQYALRGRRLEVEAAEMPRPVEKKKPPVNEQKLKASEEKRLKKAVAEVEAQIAALEAAHAADEALLATPELYKDAARAAEVTRNFAARKTEMDALYERWESLQRDLGS